MKKIIAMLLMLNAFSMSADAALKVSPMVIELDANKTKSKYLTTAFNVSAAKDETIRFKIYPSYFKITNEGKLLDLPNSNSQFSLVKNARFMPNEFTLSNGRTQKVRLTIANLDKLPQGENRMVLFLEDVVAKEVILPYHQKDINTKLVVKTRIGVPVYVDKGKFIKQARINQLAIKKDNENYLLNMQLESIGNSKVRYSAKAQIIQGKNLISEFPLNSSVIANNNVLNVSQIIPKNKCGNGDCKLRVLIKYKNEKGQNKIVKDETEFSVLNFNSDKI